MTQLDPEFSLVIPVMNEEEVLRDTYQRLLPVLDSLGLTYEVIVVDNASTDRTPQIAAELCAADPRWKFMRLSRNFGYQNSITAGQCAARGEAMMVIDSDLQDPPELIPTFIAKWREGYDVVYGVRSKRVGEPVWRVIPTMLAMRFISWMSDEVKLPLHSGDFRLITRRVRDAFAQMNETNRYVRGMIHWVGFKQVGIPYTRQGRTKGVTKVNPIYLIAFTWNAICGCSLKPLRLFTLLGAATFAAIFVMMIWNLVALLAYGAAPVSFLTMMLLLILGVQSAGIGVLGEYIGRIHSETKRRPLWLVDYSINMEAASLSQSSAIVAKHQEAA
jgi:glycosyltransferase involved in cell wall biosynthesis